MFIALWLSCRMRYFFVLIICNFYITIFAQPSIVESLLILVEKEQVDHLGEFYRQEGIENKNLGKYKNAEVLYLQALKEFTIQFDSVGIGNTYNNLAYVSDKMGKTAEALSYYYKSLDFFFLTKHTLGSIKVNVNLAGLYYLRKDYSSAVKYYYEAEMLLRSIDDPRRTANVKMGLGNIWSNNDYEGFNYDKAKESFLSALAVYMSINDSVNIGKVYNNLGWLFEEKGELDNAVQYYSKSLKVKTKLSDKAGQLVANLNVGNILKKQGKLEESLTHFREGEQLATEIGDANNYLHLLSNLVDVTAALNRVDTITIYLNKYKALKDSLFDEEKQRQISELQTLYETEQKEKALATEQKINEEKTTQNRWLIVLAIALLIAIVITIVLNERRKHALKSNAQKESKIAVLNAHIVGQEKERERIASDLHDRIGSRLNNMKMMHSQYAHQGGDLGAKVEEELASTSKTIREVSHDLASATLKRHGLVAATLQLFDAINSSGAVHAKLIIKGLENRNPPAIERVIDFCVRELVNNTLKYANATQIELQYLVNDDVLHVSFEDDGVGFDINSIDYGIGLKSIEARVASVGGELTITSDPGNGVIVGIEVSVTADKS